MKQGVKLGIHIAIGFLIVGGTCMIGLLAYDYLFVRPGVEHAIALAKADHAKRSAMSQATIISLGIAMYSNDHGDMLPPGPGAEPFSPYLSEGDLREFIYEPPRVLHEPDLEPATEIGYLRTPFGKAVIHASTVTHAGREAAAWIPSATMTKLAQP